MNALLNYTLYTLAFINVAFIVYFLREIYLLKKQETKLESLPWFKIQKDLADENN